MGLKKYYIDGSNVPPDDIQSVMEFILNQSYSSALDPNKKCSFVAFWEEDINPSDFPILQHCKIHDLS